MNSRGIWINWLNSTPRSNQMSEAKKISPGLSLNAPDVSSRQKIFILGFNRCGTQSFSAALEKIGIGCAHWDQNRLALAIANDINQGRKIDLDAHYPQCNAFMDIINVPGHGQINKRPWIEGNQFARELVKSYPDAYFILNTRPVNDWINSRLKHVNGDFIEQYRQDKLRHANQKLSKEEIILDWRYQWHKHHAEILELFSYNPSLKSLIFDITTSPYSSLKTFLSPDYSLFGDTMPWVGQTASATQAPDQKGFKHTVKNVAKKIFKSKA